MVATCKLLSFATPIPAVSLYGFTNGCKVRKKVFGTSCGRSFLL